MRRYRRRISLRKRTISEIYFKINIFSPKECLKLFLFRLKDVAIVTGVLSWQRRTKRRRLTYSPFIATCIISHHLYSPVQWFELHFMLEMPFQAMSEIFWQSLRDCTPLYEHSFEELRVNVILARARMYEDCLHESSAPFQDCLGFMDHTKIFIKRPDGASVNQHSCYSAHKRRH